MPLNTSLLPPPVEADFNALFAFDDKELIIDPDEEMVSGEFSFWICIFWHHWYFLDEEPTPKKRRGPKPKPKVDGETGDAAETASNSSAVSADTCCTCRERFAPDDVSQSCSGTCKKRNKTWIGEEKSENPLLEPVHNIFTYMFYIQLWYIIQFVCDHHILDV